MKNIIRYSIHHKYGNKYSVIYAIPTQDRSRLVNFSSNISVTSTALLKITRAATQAIYSAVFNAENNGCYLIKDRKYVWDGDTSDLPAEVASQASRKRMELSIPTETTSQAATPQKSTTVDSKAVLEVKKVGGVWTIIKHDAPLLTWEEACEVLKQKVDENV